MTEQEARQNRDRILKRMLKTPPKPHSEHGKKRKESRTPSAKDQGE